MCINVQAFQRGTQVCRFPRRAWELSSQGCSSSTSLFTYLCFRWSHFSLVLLIAMSRLFTPPQIICLPTLSTTWYHGGKNQQKFGMPTSRYVLTGLTELYMEQSERQVCPNCTITHILRYYKEYTVSPIPTNVRYLLPSWPTITDAGLRAKTEKRNLEITQAKGLIPWFLAC